MRFGVADSALKHGVIYEDIMHVVRHADYLGAGHDGMLWWIGQNQQGQSLEIGAAQYEDRGVIIVIHAMPTKWRRP